MTDVTSQTAPTTPDAARARIAALTADADFSGRYANGDKEAGAQLTALYEQAYPTVQSGDFTPEIQKAMAADLVKHGQMSREDADAALLAAGIEPDAHPESAEVAELMALFPAAKPNEYDLTGLFGDSIDDPKVAEFDRTARNWLSTARFPRREGSAFMREIIAVSRKVSGMNDTEREVYRGEQELMLRNLWREKCAENFSLACQLGDELEAKSEGFLDFIDRAGAGSSAMVVNLLAAQAQRLGMIADAKQRARKE